MTCDKRTQQQQIKDELAGITGELAGIVLPDVGQKLAYAQVPDAFGGRIESWAAAGDLFPCLISDQPITRLGPEPVNIGERLEQKTPNIVISVPTTVLLNTRDRVSVDDGFTYEVLAQQEHGSLSFLNKYGCVVVDV